MKPYARSWILFLASALLVAAGCSLGQLSQNQALGIIQKTGFFDKPQPGGLVLRLQEVTRIKNIDKGSAEAEFRWVAESKDAPECRLELASFVAFRRFESGWELDATELAKKIQSAIEGTMDSGAAERYVRLIAMAEGDFSARRGRYATLDELMNANILPRELSRKDSEIEISGYFFKLTASPDKFTLTSRSLVITEKAPAYYADSSGGIRVSTKGPATVESPFLK
jgi:hypothetical protein